MPGQSLIDEDGGMAVSQKNLNRIGRIAAHNGLVINQPFDRIACSLGNRLDNDHMALRFNYPDRFSKRR